MVDAAKRRATYQDVLDAPPNKIAEIVGGVLHVSPRPAPRHVAAASALGFELGPPFGRGRGGPGGWILLDEPELHLGHDVLVPDLAGWRTERMPELPDDEPFFRIAPDWVCEVLSPSIAKVDRAEKLPIYAGAEVPLVWLIDPTQRMLEVLRLHRNGWLLVGTWHDDARIRAEPFDAIELELGALWAHAKRVDPK